MTTTDTEGSSTSVKYVPFDGNVAHFKEWKIKILSFAESQGWRHHLDKEIKTITYTQSGMGFTDLNSNDPYDTTNCKIAVTDSEQRQFLSKTKAAATLNLAIKGNARIYIKGLTASPFKMWDAICTQYDRADFIADYHDILEEWNKATFNAHQRIPRAWFNTLDEINEKLRTAGNKKTTVDVFSYILAGIDKSKRYDNVHCDFTKFKPAEMTEAKLTKMKDGC